MKIRVTVPEVVGIFKEIQEEREKLLEMIRFDIRDCWAISDSDDKSSPHPFFGKKTL